MLGEEGAESKEWGRAGASGGRDLAGLGKRRAHFQTELVQGALRRWRIWPDREACYHYLRTRPLFATWPAESLRAYVEAGTRERPGGGVELVYLPEWEAHIFATTPTDVWQDVLRLGIPALVIRGERSRTFLPQAQRRMERLLPCARFVVVPEAGHMAPMEKPAEVGAAIRDFLPIAVAYCGRMW